MPEADLKTWTVEELGEEVGTQLFKDLVIDAPPDAYRRNALPPIDESFHTDDLIAELQAPAMHI